MSEESTVLKVVLDDDVSDGVEHELDVVGVGGAREMSIDLLGVLNTDNTRTGGMIPH